MCKRYWDLDRGEDGRGADMSFNCRMHRRDFLRTATVGAVGLAAGLHEARAAIAKPHFVGGDECSKVVIGSHGQATVDGRVQRAAVEEMVDAVVMSLSGEQTPAAAWGRYFSSDERVGIKVNGLGGQFISTGHSLIRAVVSRLTDIGVRRRNIFVWDQNANFIRNCGLKVNSKKWGISIVTMDYGWTDAAVEQRRFRGPITSLITDEIDAYINLPIMKDHSNAGVTLALKQHYGSHKNPWDHHRNHCDPYIADLNTVPAIRDKQRLIICDATRAVYDQGPGFDANCLWHPNMLLAATDPVAHDTVGAGIIEDKRREMGLPTLAEAGRPCVHIASAAERGLGTNDLEKIEVKRVQVG